MSTKIDDGGPAFPVAENHKIAADYEWTCGMSLRDWFAGKAFQALVSNHEFGGQLQRIYDANKEIANKGDENESPQEYTARIAYNLADAMLAARKERP